MEEPVFLCGDGGTDAGRIDIAAAPFHNPAKRVLQTETACKVLYFLQNISHSQFGSALLSFIQAAFSLQFANITHCVNDAPSLPEELF